MKEHHHRTVNTDKDFETEFTEKKRKLHDSPNETASDLGRLLATAGACGRREMKMPAEEQHHQMIFPV